MRLSGESDSDELEVRTEGGGVEFAIGLLLLALGLLFLLLTWHAGARRPILATMLGVAFAGVGTLVAFTAAGFRIDRRHRIVTEWSTFLGFAKTRQYNLDQFRAVQLKECWNRSRIGSKRLFRIHFCFKDGENEPLELGVIFGEERARECLRRVAEFSGLPTEEELLADRND